MKRHSTRLSLERLEDRTVPRNPGDIEWLHQFGSGPGGPAQGYFRFAISSEHTPKQLAALIQSFRELL